MTQKTMNGVHYLFYLMPLTIWIHAMLGLHIEHFKFDQERSNRLFRY